MGASAKDELVPSELLKPSFEGRYTGGTDIAACKSDDYRTYLVNPDGNVDMTYSAWKV